MRYLALVGLISVASSVASSVAGAAPVAESAAVRLLPRPGIASVAYAFEPSAKLDSGSPPDVTVHWTNVRGMLPVYRYGSGVLVVGLNYTLNYFGLINGPPIYREGRIDLHDIAVPATLSHALSARWALTITVAPTLASDLRAISAEDFLVKGRLMASWAFADDAALLFGVGVSRRFGRYFPFPLLGVSYRPEGSGFYLAAVLPSFVETGYQLAETFGLFASGKLIGRAWHLAEEGPVSEFFASYLDTRLGAGLEVSLAELLAVRFSAGVAPYRRYELRDASGNALEQSLKLGPYVEVSVALRVAPPAD